MKTMQPRPQAKVKVPPATTPARREIVPSATWSARPTTAPACPTRAPWRNTCPTRSTPTSSVTQAWSAPLVNVYATPHTAQRAITCHPAETIPTSAHAAPIPRYPMISESLLP